MPGIEGEARPQGGGRRVAEAAAIAGVEVALRFQTLRDQDRVPCQFDMVIGVGADRPVEPDAAVVHQHPRRDQPPVHMDAVLLRHQQVAMRPAGAERVAADAYQQGRLRIAQP